VLHCHDWHSALVPLTQRTRARADPVPTVLTLHNIGYQGLFGDTVLTLYGADAIRAFVPPDALAGGTINFLRAGLRAADAVTTVSPTYAHEIRTPAFGMGLEDVLNARPDDVVGILNGVDYDRRRTPSSISTTTRRTSRRNLRSRQRSPSASGYRRTRPRRCSAS
jgi:starch synthase